jgi:hypothetical protein
MKTAVLAAVALVGCGADRIPRPPNDLTIDRVSIGFVDVDPSVPQDSARWKRALEESAAWWGVALSDLAGLEIGVTSSKQFIESACQVGWVGCQQLDRIWMLAEEPSCPERYLAHEIGHFIAGPEHTDPRFVGSANVTREAGCWQ